MSNLVECEYCKKTINVPSYRLRRAKRIFCNNKCKGLFFKGKPNLKNRLYNQYLIHEKYAEIVINSAKYGEIKTKIDIESVEKCKPFRWAVRFDDKLDNFYVVMSARLGFRTTLHQLLVGVSDNLEVDHINRDPLDNRRKNLLPCYELFRNRQNQGFRKDNTTGFKNVFYNKKNNNYRLIIKRNKTKILDRSFETKEEAALYRNRYIEETGICYAT